MGYNSPSMKLIHFDKDMTESDIASELEKREPRVRLATASELGLDFFLGSFGFPVVVITEQGAICMLPHPGVMAQDPQFCFKRWSSTCRFPVVEC